MSSPSIAWEGINRVAQSFYGGFLPQLRELVGEEMSDALIEAHLSSQARRWLSDPTLPNPSLGYGMGAAGHE